MSVTDGNLVASDYRVIGRVASLRITGNGYHVSASDLTVAEAHREVVAARGAKLVYAICEATDTGAVISGPPDAVLPVLIALLDRADTGASDE